MLFLRRHRVSIANVGVVGRFYCRPCRAKSTAWREDSGWWLANTPKYRGGRPAARGRSPGGGDCCRTRAAQCGALAHGMAEVARPRDGAIEVLRAHSEIPLRVSLGDVDRGWHSSVAEVTSALLAAVR